MDETDKTVTEIQTFLTSLVERMGQLGTISHEMIQQQQKITLLANTIEQWPKDLLDKISGIREKVDELMKTIQDEREDRIRMEAEKRRWQEQMDVRLASLKKASRWRLRWIGLAVLVTTIIVSSAWVLILLKLKHG